VDPQHEKPIVRVKKDNPNALAGWQVLKVINHHAMLGARRCDNHRLMPGDMCRSASVVAAPATRTIREAVAMPPKGACHTRTI
jgi:hypothetical protein